MPSATPLFSVVMPTRNRATLLPYALSSALAQGTDCEIVVSDNHSEDGTSALLDGFADPRLRRVRTPRMLSMTESWEFALAQARGRYVSLLCDDDAYLPGVLERAARVIEDSHAVVLVYPIAHYLHPSFFLSHERNTVYVPETTGALCRYPATTLLRELYDLQHGPEMPLMLNGFCRRDIIDAARARLGRFFVPFSPDYGAAPIILTQVEEVHFDDRLGAVGGNGSSQRPYLDHYLPRTGGRDSVRELLGQGVDGVHDCVPLKSMLSFNSVTQTIAKAQQLLPERLAAYPLNWTRYFIECHRQLLFYGEDGGAVAPHLAAFQEALAAQVPAVRQAVAEQLEIDRAREPGRPVPIWHALLRGLLRRSGWLSDLRHQAQRRRHGGPRRYRGSRYGFQDIWGCAQWLHARSLPRLGHADNAR